MHTLDQLLGKLPETQEPGSSLVWGLKVYPIQHLQDEGERKVHLAQMEIFLM